MNETKRGYFWYSTFVVLFFILLLAFIGYLIYDLILKLSIQDFSNNIAIQALITLIITVFIGGFFTKSLEFMGFKKIELYKIRTDIALNVIDLASALYHNPEDERIFRLLVAEASKVKLYFPDEVLKSLNDYMKNYESREIEYTKLIDELKRNTR